MMSSNLTVYQYPKCSTCRNAIKWLEKKGLQFNSIHIIEHPPDQEELAKFVQASGLELKKFFNVSGLAYKEMKLKDQLPTMTDEEKIALLASNGRLIKRPIVTDGNKVTVGFKEEEFADTWG